MLRCFLRCFSLLILTVALMLSTGSFTADAAPGGPLRGPSRCVLQANDPHISSHQPGRINAEARTTCENSVVRMEISAQLWEKRWWGWDRIGTVGHFSAGGVNRGSAFANVPCRNNQIKMTTSGSVHDIDGHTYTATDESQIGSIRCANR